MSLGNSNNIKRIFDLISLERIDSEPPYYSSFQCWSLLSKTILQVEAIFVHVNELGLLAFLLISTRHTDPDPQNLFNADPDLASDP